MKIYTENYDTLKQLLASPQKIVIITHKNPDGDAVGSLLGLYNFLVSLNHVVFPVTPDEYPSFLKWLPNNKEVIIYNRHHKKVRKQLELADIIFCVDFNHLSRIDELEKYVAPTKAFKILIDHHPGPDTDFDFILSETEASSTAELIWEFINIIDPKKARTKAIAECIYAGIMTDTGCFSFNSSRPETFNTVGQLLEIGIDKDRIYNLVYDNYSSHRMKLMGYALHQKMQVFPEFSAAFINLTQAELKEYNYVVGDTEGFVNLPLSIEGIKFSALFTENKDIIKASFRSKGNFSVNAFAKKHFNGGGHKNAAGGESQQSMDETINTFINLLSEYKTELDQE